jgi:hypothetical protein
MDGSTNGLDWFTGVWNATKYRLSIGVPMIPTTSSNVPVGTLAEGATGAYNHYFVTLAKNLISGGEGDSFLRLGWEFDGTWYAWKANTLADEENYAEYFRQIVTAMRSVSGENFQFIWNPDAVAFTTPGYSVEAAYPGSAYVNAIGLDVYDQSWITPMTQSNVWKNTIQPALSAAKDFASTQNIPLAICEWGDIILRSGHGLGDDPLYTNNMLNWIADPVNHVKYESYFNRNTIPYGGLGNALLTGGHFPRSLAAFQTQQGLPVVASSRIG